VWADYTPACPVEVRDGEPTTLAHAMLRDDARFQP